MQKRRKQRLIDVDRLLAALDSITPKQSKGTFYQAIVKLIENQPVVTEREADDD